MAEFTPKKPDFTLSAMDKDTARMKGQVGVAWKLDNGSIRIKLNEFIVLDTRQHDLVLTLFPTDRPGPNRGKPQTPTFDEPPPY